MSDEYLDLQAAVQYDLFSHADQQSPVGYLLDRVYYAEPGDHPAETNTEHGLFFYKKADLQKLMYGTPAGRLEDNVIVSNNGNRYYLKEL
ncbi:hypothetical protein QN372_15810 [Undibacterium sp. RTI2.1]|uniref:hypothetical protein n=1 Tax=unclassified Undibacterium TaxID=2630295 RepID=UPI002B2271CD|nr:MULTISPECIES: hypothetical protein [unclassified Undibacterium]MEB0032224.1 hypothetical protein [Undibacterium sp. RTI2.1]MEB0117030.1 hypothetical protein [Undibacterium sp. RTI2.2]